MKYTYKSLLLFTFLLFLADCTTQKRKGDMSALAKLYENTTAKYNGYFNARELLRASILDLNEQHEDNYNKILDLYQYVEVENPQAVASNLDEAIKKVSVVVSLHRESVWTDDCYLLVGQAQYLKQDYEGAEETLRYMVEEFSPAKMAKKKRLSKKDKKVGKKKVVNGKSSKKVSDKKTEEDKESEDRAKSAAKRRKAYNKQVKKKKKSSSSKKKTSSSKKKSSKRVIRPESAPKLADEEETTEDEPLADGLIRLSDREEIDPNKKPEKYGIKHRPAYQESVLWLARTLIERENYSGAQRYMSQLERDPTTFKDIKEELSAVQAYYHLAQKDYERALNPLEKAIKLADKKKDKARYAYIIAQIHQEAGRGDAAYVSFEKVLKHGPEYEMEFGAKLNLAQNAYINGKGSAAEARKNLNKMLKDIKNEEYKDQIYYALAQIDLKQNDREKAIENLSLALKYSRSNRTQKAEAYYTLGTLYMEEESYVNAKFYFDSTLQVLTNTDERFDEVTKLSNSLTEISESIQTIALQDSLLKISGMTDAEKRALAFEIKKQDDERRRQKAAAKTSAGGNNNPRNTIAPGRKLSSGVGTSGALKKESSFFAYDDRALKRGARDFARKWEDRKLEDNWRRSNKRSTGDFEEIEEEEEVPSTVFTDEDVKKYLKGVPNTESEKKAAHLKIQEAMFTLGSLYRERLKNYPKSVEILEGLSDRYPNNTFELDAWYYLYLDYKDLKNDPKAQVYYDKIISKYGNSTYAMILKDPNYASKIQDKEKILNNYYDRAYSAFTSGQYKVAYDKSVAAKGQFGASNSLQPKFALLAAMSTGNLQGKDAYVNALKDVVAKYPDTPEQTRAKEILRLLGGGSTFLPGNEKAQESVYKTEPEKLHYIIIAFNKDVSLTDNKAKVSDFNRKYHKLDKLRISNIYLGAEVRTPIIVIRRFKDKAAAMKYFKGTQINKKDFISKDNDFEIFAITQNNYRLVLKNKTLDGYREFFEAEYKR